VDNLSEGRKVSFGKGNKIKMEASTIRTPVTLNKRPTWHTSRQCYCGAYGSILSDFAWVRERTIPTELPPLVAEVSVNFCGKGVSRGQRDGSLGFLERRRYFFLQVAPPVVLTRLSGPRSRPTTSQKIWICSHELWPLDHRGGLFQPKDEIISQITPKPVPSTFFPFH
jgi:hypothetical protein